MLIEQKSINKIEIVGNFIQVREKITILKDGVQIAANFNRFVLKQQDDRNNLDPQVKKIADALWGEQENLNNSQVSDTV